jgi:hypothetical protein
MMINLVLMATVTIEYDARNKTSKQVIDGQISSGDFRVKDNAENERIAIKKNAREVKKMIEDIRQNGLDRYMNMDDFLETLKNKADVG